MRRGDVVWAQLPRPVAKAGHEQIGTRPAIVLQSDESVAKTGTIVIIPLTSNQAAMRYPGSFQLHPSKGNGLSTLSIALIHQVRAIDKKRISGIAGHLSQDELEQVEAGIQKLLLS